MEKSVETTLKEFLDAAHIAYGGIVQSETAGQMIFSIQTEDPSLIGMNGDTVQALDYLVKKVIEKRMSPVPLNVGEVGTDLRIPRFLVDVNDYRVKQIKDLQNKALMMAERARSLQYNVELSPMSSYERLIIHTALQGALNVKTVSEGEGRNRRVVIQYASEIDRSVQ
ncbi:MAG: R3H domain-containing nucleic acid-binding protein [Patescibacteria group bacterium]